MTTRWACLPPGKRIQWLWQDGARVQILQERLVLHCSVPHPSGQAESSGYSFPSRVALPGAQWHTENLCPDVWDSSSLLPPWAILAWHCTFHPGWVQRPSSPLPALRGSATSGNCLLPNRRGVTVSRTIRHKRDGFKQHKCILFPEVRSRQGCVPSKGTEGESVFLPFPASKGRLHSLARGPFLHLQV